MERTTHATRPLACISSDSCVSERGGSGTPVRRPRRQDRLPQPPRVQHTQHPRDRVLVSPHQPTSGYYPRILSQESTDLANGWTVSQQETGVSTLNPTFRNGSALQDSLDTGSPFVANVWQRVYVRFDGTKGNGGSFYSDRIAVWRNGVQVNPPGFYGGGNIPSSIGATTAAFRLCNASATAGAFWKGELAEIGIWLDGDSTRIAGLAKGQAPSFFPTNLHVYLPLKAGDGARDETGNAGTPTITGTTEVAHPTGITYPASAPVPPPPPPPAPTVRVSVSPSSITLDAGHPAIQFIGTAVDTTDPRVAWSSTCGAITQTGLYQPMTTATTCSVRVTHVALGVSAVASVVTVAPLTPTPIPEPPPPPTGTTVYISDLPFLSSVNGWGPVERDTSNGEQAANDGRTLTINGVTYAKGLGVHAASDVRLLLNGATRFEAVVGIDDEVNTRGTARFEVWVDGVRKVQSAELNGTQPGVAIAVDVTGGKELRLVVTGGNNVNSDHADWGNARLTTASVAAAAGCTRTGARART